MTRKRTLLLSGSALMVAAIGIVAGSFVGREARRQPVPPKPEIDSRLAVGSSIPDATFLATYGDTIHLQDLIAGEKAVLIFLSTTCTPCVDLAADWRDIFPGHGSEYELIGVSAEPSAVIDRFVGRWGISFQVVVDPDSSFAREYQIVASPTLLGIGEDGVIAFAEIGYHKGDADKVRHLLELF